MFHPIILTIILIITNLDVNMFLEPNELEIRQQFNYNNDWNLGNISETDEVSQLTPSTLYYNGYDSSWLESLRTNAQSGKVVIIVNDNWTLALSSTQVHPISGIWNSDGNLESDTFSNIELYSFVSVNLPMVNGNPAKATLLCVIENTILCKFTVHQLWDVESNLYRHDIIISEGIEEINSTFIFQEFWLDQVPIPVINWDLIQSEEVNCFETVSASEVTWVEADGNNEWATDWRSIMWTDDDALSLIDFDTMVLTDENMPEFEPSCISEYPDILDNVFEGTSIYMPLLRVLIKISPEISFRYTNGDAWGTITDLYYLADWFYYKGIEVEFAVHLTSLSFSATDYLGRERTATCKSQPSFLYKEILPTLDDWAGNSNRYPSNGHRKHNQFYDSFIYLIEQDEYDRPNSHASGCIGQAYAGEHKSSSSVQWTVWYEEQNDQISPNIIGPISDSKSNWQRSYNFAHEILHSLVQRQGFLSGRDPLHDDAHYQSDPCSQHTVGDSRNACWASPLNNERYGFTTTTNIIALSNAIAWLPYVRIKNFGVGQIENTVHGFKITENHIDISLSTITIGSLNFGVEHRVGHPLWRYYYRIQEITLNSCTGIIHELFVGVRASDVVGGQSSSWTHEDLWLGYQRDGAKEYIGNVEQFPYDCQDHSEQIDWRFDSGYMMTGCGEVSLVPDNSKYCADKYDSNGNLIGLKTPLRGFPEINSYFMKDFDGTPISGNGYGIQEVIVWPAYRIQDNGPIYGYYEWSSITWQQVERSSGYNPLVSQPLVGQFGPGGNTIGD